MPVCREDVKASGEPQAPVERADLWNGGRWAGRNKDCSWAGGIVRLYSRRRHAAPYRLGALRHRQESSLKTACTGAALSSNVCGDPDDFGCRETIMGILEYTRARSPALAAYLEAVAARPLSFDGAHPLDHSSDNHVHLWKVEYLADRFGWIDVDYRVDFVSHVLERWARRLKGLPPTSSGRSPGGSCWQPSSATAALSASRLPVSCTCRSENSVRSSSTRGSAVT